MTASAAWVIAAQATTTSEVRVAWKTCERSGAGSWHPISDKGKLIESIKALNTQHGPGTHWLEERTA